MKQININNFIYGNDLNITEEMEVLGMKFIKMKDGNYMIENSNGKIVSEKEKLQLENQELVIQDITSNKCQKDTTKKISKNKKRIEELDNGNKSKAK